MEQEIWKDIKGLEGRYQISSLGKVRSLPKSIILNGREIFYPERILKPIDAKGKTSNGYVRVKLGTGRGKRRALSIHRLVAMHFIPNPNNLPQVNHINGNKHDNRVENLEWCTAQQNTQHALMNGLKKKFGHAEGDPVIARNIETGEEIYFESVASAGRYLGQSCDHGLKRRKEQYKNIPYIVNGYELRLADKIKYETEIRKSQD